MGRLSGKVAIITGAGRGIGRTLAEGFAAEGARVLAADRDRSGAEATVTSIRDAGGAGEAFEVDVACADQAAALVATAGEALGPVVVLISNAGVAGFVPSLEITEAEWDRVVDTNLRGTFFCAQAAARVMVARGRGSIVYLSSQLAAAPRKNTAHYVASKAGLVGLAKAMALDLGPYNVRVNAIMPGVIETEMNRARLVKTGEREGDVRRIALGRLGSPRDILGAAIFLASEESAYVTGTCLRVDGGWLG